MALVSECTMKNPKNCQLFIITSLPILISPSLPLSTRDVDPLTLTYSLSSLCSLSSKLWFGSNSILQGRGVGSLIVNSLKFSFWSKKRQNLMPNTLHFSSELVIRISNEIQETCFRSAYIDSSCRLGRKKCTEKVTRLLILQLGRQILPKRRHSKSADFWQRQISIKYSRCLADNWMFLHVE